MRRYRRRTANVRSFAADFTALERGDAGWTCKGEPVSSCTVRPGARIGTWSVKARADDGAVTLLLGLPADILLLTEVHPALSLPGYRMTELIEPRMKPSGQHYAAVAAREGLDLRGLPSPAVTTAAARVGGITFASTVLPWVRAPFPPYVGATQAEQIENAVGALVPWLADKGSWCGAVTGAARCAAR